MTEMPHNELLVQLTKSVENLKLKIQLKQKTDISRNENYCNNSKSLNNEDSLKICNDNSYIVDPFYAISLQSKQLMQNNMIQTFRFAEEVKHFVVEEDILPIPFVQLNGGNSTPFPDDCQYHEGLFSLDVRLISPFNSPEFEPYASALSCDETLVSDSVEVTRDWRNLRITGLCPLTDTVLTSGHCQCCCHCCCHSYLNLLPRYKASRLSQTFPLLPLVQRLTRHQFTQQVANDHNSGNYCVEMDSSVESESSTSISEWHTKTNKNVNRFMPNLYNEVIVSDDVGRQYVNQYWLPTPSRIGQLLSNGSPNYVAASKSFIPICQLVNCLRVLDSRSIQPLFCYIELLAALEYCSGHKSLVISDLFDFEYLRHLTVHKQPSSCHLRRVSARDSYYNHIIHSFESPKPPTPLPDLEPFQFDTDSICLFSHYRPILKRCNSDHSDQMNSSMVFKTVSFSQDKLDRLLEESVASTEAHLLTEVNQSTLAAALDSLPYSEHSALSRKQQRHHHHQQQGDTPISQSGVIRIPLSRFIKLTSLDHLENNMSSLDSSLHTLRHLDIFSLKNSIKSAIFSNSSTTLTSSVTRSYPPPTRPPPEFGSLISSTDNVDEPVIPELGIEPIRLSRSGSADTLHQLSTVIQETDTLQFDHTNPSDKDQSTLQRPPRHSANEMAQSMLRNLSDRQCRGSRQYKPQPVAPAIPANDKENNVRKKNSNIDEALKGPETKKKSRQRCNSEHQPKVDGDKSDDKHNEMFATNLISQFADMHRETEVKRMRNLRDKAASFILNSRLSFNMWPRESMMNSSSGAAGSSGPLEKSNIERMLASRGISLETGKTNYQCKRCSAVFRLNSELRQHMRVHKKEASNTPGRGGRFHTFG